MNKKFLMCLLAVPVAAFGPYFLADMLFELRLSDFGGLLIMGMLLFGWPVTSTWLGICAGKDFKGRWFLPVLFALTMPAVFPYYNAGVYAWLYAGGILLTGLIVMLGTWWNHREEQNAA